MTRADKVEGGEVDIQTLEGGEMRREGGEGTAAEHV